MRYLSLLFATALLSLSQNALAEKASDSKSKEAIQKMVPGAKVVSQDGNEYEILTPKQTVMEIELDRDGKIDEASGDAFAAGDIFQPGDGMISLSDAAASLQKSGKMPTGDWSYEKSMTKGWVYEFEGSEDGKKMEYSVSAKDGKIVKDSRDLF